jgi:hypothetical protein
MLSTGFVKITRLHRQDSCALLRTDIKELFQRLEVVEVGTDIDVEVGGGL